MAQSYDFALDKIGTDVQSFSIWNDYANFLKSVEAVGSYAENQKISAIRKVNNFFSCHCESIRNCIMLYPHGFHPKNLKSCTGISKSCDDSYG